MNESTLISVYYWINLQYLSPGFTHEYYEPCSFQGDHSTLVVALYYTYFQQTGSLQRFKTKHNVGPLFKFMNECVVLVQNGSCIITEITLGAIMSCIPVRRWFQSSKMPLCMCADPLARACVCKTESNRINVKLKRINEQLFGNGKDSCWD